jgi:hypothetical protein
VRAGRREGNKTFDYHVTDAKNGDMTIADAERGGGGTCDSGTHTCTYGNLPYEWPAMGAGEIVIDPTHVASGYRIGAAAAFNAVEPGGDLPLVFGPGDTMTIDTTGAEHAAVSVYLFRTADTSGPTISTPRVRFQTNATIGTTVPVRVGWTGSDPAGVDHYSVHVSVDGGSYHILASSLHATSLLTQIAAGHDYRYRVRGVDKLGNVGAWKYSPILRLRSFQDSSSATHYVGTWHNRSSAIYMGGSARYSFTAGATVQVTFSGRAVAWISRESLDSGKAAVLIDSHYVMTVDLNGPGRSPVIDFGRSWGSSGTHTIKIVVKGTAGHPRVTHDAFLVLY